MIRRRILAIALSLAMFILSAPSIASAAEISVCGVAVKGAVLTTALKAAGGGGNEAIEENLGCPESPEVKLVVSSRNTYHQEFKKGQVVTTVFWSSYQGGKWWKSNADKPNIGGVDNDRDALNRYGFKGGMLMRSAKLNSISTSGKQLLVTMIHGGIVLDLRDSGTADPNFPYITEIRAGIPGHSSSYNLFVTGSAERTGISKAMQVLADSPKAAPIWVHCAVGRDRTGVIVSLVLVVLGAEAENSNWGDVYDEYLRTSSADEDNLVKFFDTIAEKYGVEAGYPDDGRNGVINYLKSIDVTEADMDNIREKFTLAA